MSQIVKGKIVSYLNGQNGFITGDDGINYHFEHNDLIDPEFNRSGIINKKVAFIPIPTEKGMIAKHISVIHIYKTKYLPSYRFYNYGTQLNGTVEFSLDVETPKFTSLEEARDFLHGIAERTGCNAIIDARMQKTRDISFNNYVSFSFRYSAKMAIVSQTRTCYTKSELEKENSDFKAEVVAIREYTYKCIDDDKESRKNIFRKFIIATMLFIFLWCVGQGIKDHGSFDSLFRFPLFVLPFLPSIIALLKKSELIRLVLILNLGIPICMAVVFSFLNITLIIFISGWICSLIVTLSPKYKVIDFFKKHRMSTILDKIGIH